MRRPMRKGFFILFGISFVVIVFWMLNIVTAASETLCVCHVENKESGKGHVIKVDKDSLEGHLKHGDVQCTVDCEKAIGTSCHASTGGDCKERSD